MIIFIIIPIIGVTNWHFQVGTFHQSFNREDGDSESDPDAEYDERGEAVVEAQSFSGEIRADL